MATTASGGSSCSIPRRRCRSDGGPGVRSAHRDRSRPVTRLLRGHPEIEVELDDGRLVVAWSGRREQVEVCNRWRVEESWWREPIARDYFKVVGAHWLALIYFDRVAGTWHLERLYD